MAAIIVYIVYVGGFIPLRPLFMGVYVGTIKVGLLFPFLSLTVI